MNLINDAWIPVRRKSGVKMKTAPWQITEGLNNDPIIELAAVRPDFNGALIQFLIGLLQTACPPKGNTEWKEWLDNPPSPEQLKEKFNHIANAFNLNGDGPRFMQDLTLENEKILKPWTIDKLLIDSPGEKPLKERTDFFIKRDRIKNMCQNCAAQALLTLQINGPQGGSGHRVGLRGGGPVTTIVLQDNLWKTAWFNILNKDSFDNLASTVKNKVEDKFPWLSETRTSQNDLSTTAQDINAAQIYWSMPRRIRLIFEHSTEKLACELCGEKSESFVRKYLTIGHGVKYQNPIIHPLTPVYMKDNVILSVLQHEEIGYKHWLGLVQSIADNNQNKTPALIINRVFEDFRLWAFGYDMKQMKARCWYEGVMPVLVLKDTEKMQEYTADVSSIIKSAKFVSEKLKFAVKNALNSKKWLSSIVARYWQETEADFYNILGNLREIIKREIIKNANEIDPLKQNWQRILARKAEQIFNESSQMESIEMIDVKRVAKAWNEMRKSIYGKKIKEILGLPEKKGGEIDGI